MTIWKFGFVRNPKIPGILRALNAHIRKYFIGYKHLEIYIGKNLGDTRLVKNLRPQAKFDMKVRH